MIICPSRKPRSTVRGPTESLKEKVSPGRIDRAVDVLGHQVDVVDPVRRRGAHLGREARDPLADPERLASAVVRSARVCFRRSDARPDRGRRGEGDRAEIQRPSGVEAGSRGHGSGRGSRRPRTARCGSRPPLRQVRLDRLGDPVGVERDAEPVAGGAEADQPRQALRRERADVLALEGERDRRGRRAPAPRRPPPRRRSCQLGLDVRQGRPTNARGSAEARLAARPSSCSGSTALPVRDGITLTRRAAMTTCAAVAAAAPARRSASSLDAGAGHEHRVDRQRRRARVDQRAHSGPERAVARPDGAAGRRGVDQQASPGRPRTSLAVDETVDRRARSPRGRSTPGQRPVQ